MPIGVIAGIAGSAIQGIGAARGARAQTRAANQDMAFQTRIYDEGMQRLQPFYQGGLQANNAYMFENGLAARPEGYTGFEESRGQQFMRQQGLDAIQASAAAQGGLFSAATMDDLGRQNSDFANTYREQYLNRLAGLSDGGMQAASMQGTTGANAAAGMSNALGARGNALSAGAIGGANALTGGIENALAGFNYQRGLAQGGAQGGARGINGNGAWANGLFGGKGLGGFV